MRKATEPEMTPYEQQQLAVVLRRLVVASKLEREARAEVDRLMRLAWNAGATDHTLGASMGIKLDAARMRRRRQQLRGDRGRTYSRAA